MGYTTRFTGQIKINPPIPWEDIKDSSFLPENARRPTGGRDLRFVIDGGFLDDGLAVGPGRAVALESTWEDEARGYYMVPHLQEAVDAHPDHEFTGRIDCEGEESGDLWRLEVHDRRAVRVNPRIVWPGDPE